MRSIGRAKRQVAFRKHDGTTLRVQQRSPKLRTAIPDTESMFSTSSTDLQNEIMTVPHLFTQLPVIRDLLITQSSSVQDATVEQCLPFLQGTANTNTNTSPFDFNEHGLLRLDRQQHVAYLHDALGTFPAAFVGVDASRPWMLYWALTGLYVLGEDVAQYRERLASR